MEHIHPAHPGDRTLEVFRRFVKRKVHGRVAPVVGGVVIALGITGATLLLPTPAHLASRSEAAVEPTSGAGVVTSLVRRAVGSPFSGDVQTMVVRPGQKVHKGQLLFQMDTRPLQTELAAAREELKSARQTYAEAQAERRQELAPFVAQIAQLKSSLAQLSMPVSGPVSGPVSAPVAAPMTPLGDAPAMRDGDDTDGSRTADDSAPQVVVFRPRPDPVALQDLQTRIQAAEKQLQEKDRSWAESTHEMNARVNEAANHVRHLEAMIATSRRVSPMDGVVSTVSANSGETVSAKAPVVQIDDPRTYRVVVTVDEGVAKAMSPGAPVPINDAGTPSVAHLEKVVRGWDKDLFNYYLWLKPTRAEGLHFGEHVTVQLPRSPQQAAL